VYRYDEKDRHIDSVIASIVAEAKSINNCYRPLVGDADIPDVHAHAGAIEAGIPGSKRVVVTDAGHLMYLEKPEEFSRVVIAFIDSSGPQILLISKVLQ